MCRPRSAWPIWQVCPPLLLPMQTQCGRFLLRAEPRDPRGCGPSHVSVGAGSMSAAFAASSIAFRNVDKAYAQGLLDTAAALYVTAQKHPGLCAPRPAPPPRALYSSLRAPKPWEDPRACCLFPSPLFQTPNLSVGHCAGVDNPIRDDAFLVSARDQCQGSGPPLPPPLTELFCASRAGTSPKFMSRV